MTEPKGLIRIALYEEGDIITVETCRGKTYEIEVVDPLANLIRLVKSNGMKSVGSVVALVGSTTNRHQHARDTVDRRYPGCMVPGQHVVVAVGGDRDFLFSGLVAIPEEGVYAQSLAA